MRTEELARLSPGSPRVLVDYYDTMYEMVNKCRTGETDMLDSLRPSKRTSMGDWTGVRDLDQACDMALYGWPEGLERINKALVKVQAAIPGVGKKKVTQYALTGPGTLDSSRYMTGHPKMIRKRVTVPTTAPTGGKIVKLYYNYAVSAAVTTDEKFEVGARIVALIQALEALGNQCELYLVNGNYSWGKATKPQHHIVTVAKRAGEPVNMENIAFLLCSPAMDRYLAFSLMEQWPKEERVLMNVQSGMMPGAMSWYPPDAATDPNCIKVDAQSAHDINSGKYEWDSNKRGMKWLLAQLERFGVTFEDNQ